MLEERRHEFFSEKRYFHTVSGCVMIVVVNTSISEKVTSGFSFASH